MLKNQNLWAPEHLGDLNRQPLDFFSVSHQRKRKRDA